WASCPFGRGFSHISNLRDPSTENASLLPSGDRVGSYAKDPADVTAEPLPRRRPAFASKGKSQIRTRFSLDEKASRFPFADIAGSSSGPGPVVIRSTSVARMAFASRVSFQMLVAPLYSHAK